VKIGNNITNPQSAVQEKANSHTSGTASTPDTSTNATAATTTTTAADNTNIKKQKNTTSEHWADTLVSEEAKYLAKLTNHDNSDTDSDEATSASHSVERDGKSSLSQNKASLEEMRYDKSGKRSAASNNARKSPKATSDNNATQHGSTTVTAEARRKKDVASTSLSHPSSSQQKNRTPHRRRSPLPFTPNDVPSGQTDLNQYITGAALSTGSKKGQKLVNAANDENADKETDVNDSAAADDDVLDIADSVNHEVGGGGEITGLI
jgi:hypothetical protein